MLQHERVNPELFIARARNQISIFGEGPVPEPELNTMRSNGRTNKSRRVVVQNFEFLRGAQLFLSLFSTTSSRSGMASIEHWNGGYPHPSFTELLEDNQRIEWGLDSPIHKVFRSRISAIRRRSSSGASASLPCLILKKRSSQDSNAGFRGAREVAKVIIQTGGGMMEAPSPTSLPRPEAEGIHADTI
ncbi:hypothetical protein B0H17DRAFT_1131406 [Mycena rosella]|uniref:Uncharacterized protein n=1 Tax=Mycena rosella TaxID=1033263 RepID=A0AAD7DND5_MYCRO|nr:hypothetical protein B0H17DRAFT_1131406 [Mycena rosella]